MRLALIDLDTNALIAPTIDTKLKAEETEKLFEQLSNNYLFLLESYLLSYKYADLKEVRIECLVDIKEEPKLLKIDKKF